MGFGHERLHVYHAAIDYTIDEESHECGVSRNDTDTDTDPDSDRSREMSANQALQGRRGQTNKKAFSVVPHLCGATPENAEMLKC